MATSKKDKPGSSRSQKANAKNVSAAKAMPRPLKGSAKKAQPKNAEPLLSKKTVQKSVQQKKAVKKAPPQAKPAKKVIPTAAAPKKDLVKKTVSNATLPTPKTEHKSAPKIVPVAEPKKARLQKRDLDQFKIELLAMRDRITGQSGSMRSAALQRTDEINPEEDGTDAFMRLQTLEQVSSQQQLIANIDEALRSIEKGTYGVCDTCGELISKPRMTVLPFAKNCIKCQSEMERAPRPGGRR